MNSTFIFDIVGQILPHSLNIEGNNLTIVISTSYENATSSAISESWTIEMQVDASLLSTKSSLNGEMSIADTLTSTANLLAPRSVFFDVYTRPGDIYLPMEVEAVVPRNTLDRPGASICSFKVIYSGKYAKCIQEEVVNDPKYTVYQQR